jgi:predicted HTH transcriptional regulator
LAYEPITRPEDLPPIGRLAEHLRLDFKGEQPEKVNQEHLEEMAKDIAAFANSSGGVIVVGAKEGGGYLREYKGMRKDEARRVQKDYQRAVDLCSPRPVIDTRVLELPGRDDEHVVAVNVDAYAAPPIGVSRRDQSGGEVHWRFPVRRGDDTRDVSVRRTA